MNLERGAIAVDRLVFCVGKTPAIERHVPREVDAGRCATGNGPIDEDRAAVGVAPEIAHLPVAVHERLRCGIERGDEEVGVAEKRNHDVCQSRGHRGQPSPPFVCNLRDLGAGSQRLFARGNLRREERIPARERYEPDGVLPPPEGGVEFRHVVEEPEILLGRNHVVTLGDEPRAHVTHEDGRAARFPRDADETMIDRRWHAGEQSRPPNEEGTAADVAGRPHDPIVLDADVLHDEACAVDDDTFHRHAGLV